MSNSVDFSLLSSFALIASVTEPPKADLLVPNLQLHLLRFSDAHSALARLLPDCWCAREHPVEPAQIIEALETAIKSLTMPIGLARVRITVGPLHRVSVVTMPFSSLGSTSLRVRLDDRPTDYENPFLLFKTTHREHYDTVRERHDAKYQPKESELFDVLMYNTARQITETTIANVAFRRKSPGNLSKNPWITPKLKCGLLNGVRRQVLLRGGVIEEGIIELDKLIEDGLENWQAICFNEVRIWNGRILACFIRSLEIDSFGSAHDTANMRTSSVTPTAVFVSFCRFVLPLVGDHYAYFLFSHAFSRGRWTSGMLRNRDGQQLSMNPYNTTQPHLAQILANSKHVPHLSLSQIAWIIVAGTIFCLIISFLIGRRIASKRILNQPQIESNVEKKSLKQPKIESFLALENPPHTIFSNPAAKAVLPSSSLFDYQSEKPSGGPSHFLPPISLQASFTNSDFNDVFQVLSHPNSGGRTDRGEAKKRP
ncbi:hypothetical protein O181_056347 [Austropuccinia psidii MF-1]|uniref:Uncharacterized protein n=1 Tax=Austropuccinia psidii MF-1 TaxID=1389203 RepID=A0A9Q3EFI8_9BASI|nr:hypothetical protein [Austropuccinia psidii MF-1]